MSRTNEENDTAMQSTWSTGHAGGVTSPNQAWIAVHTDKLAMPPGYSKSAGLPIVRVSVIDDYLEIPCN